MDINAGLVAHGLVKVSDLLSKSFVAIYALMSGSERLCVYSKRLLDKGNTSN